MVALELFYNSVADILKLVKLQIWNRKSVKTWSRSGQTVMISQFTKFSYCLMLLAVKETKIFMIYVNCQIGTILSQGAVKGSWTAMFSDIHKNLSFSGLYHIHKRQKKIKDIFRIIIIFCLLANFDQTPWPSPAIYS